VSEVVREWWRPDPLVGTVAGGPAQPAVRAREPAAGRLAFRALIALTIVMIVAPQEFIAPLRPLRLALLAAVVALGAHVYDRWSGRLVTGRTPRDVWLALALMTWATATIPFSFWPSGSLATLLDLFSKSVALFVLLAGVVDTRRRLWTISWTLALSSAPVALTAIRNYALGIYMDGGFSRIAGYGSTGLAGNPNDLALLMNLVIPLVAALVATTRGVFARAVALGLLLLAAAAVVVTFSRSGFLTLATIILLYLWRFVRTGRPLLAAAVVAAALAGLLAAPSGYRDRLSTVVNIESDRTQSAQSRWHDMQVAADFVMRHPVFGAGLGQDVLALNDLRGNDWVSVHNVYLNYAMDLGLLGLALFLLLFASVLAGVIRVERRHRRRGGDDDLARLGGAIKIALLAFAVSAFFYPVAYHLYFYYFAGLAVAVRRLDAAARPAPVRPAMASL
jgi:O-antigen ligase